jgi:hypothetical protein
VTPCERIQVAAAGLASLPATDPERVAAFDHARTCAACARALAEGAALLRIIETDTAVEAPAPQALDRAAAGIRRELRRAWHTSRAGAVALSIGAAWVLALASGRRAAAHGEASLAIAAVAALASAGAMALWTPLLLAVPLVSLIVATLAGAAGPLDAAVGVRCLGVELAAAVLPLAVAFLLARRGAFARPAVALAAAAGGGALGGQAALEITCHGLRTHAHLLTFHTGGVVLALLIGLLAGRAPARATG